MTIGADNMAGAAAAHLMRPLRAQRGRMRAWPRRDCEVDPAGIDASGPAQAAQARAAFF